MSTARTSGLPSELGTAISASMRDRIEAEADVTVGQRAVLGPPAYSVIAIGFQWSEFAHQAPRTTLLLAAGMLVCSALRAVFMRPEHWVGRVGVSAWRRLFTLTGLAMGLSHGIFVAAAIRMLGLTFTTALLLATTAALATGGTYTLSPKPVARYFALVLIVPPWVVMATSNANFSSVVAVYGALLAAYSSHLGWRLYLEYWQAAVSRAQLEERTLDLLRSQRQLRDVIEKSPDAMLVLDGDEILFANAAWARLLQRDSTEVTGRSIQEFVRAEDVGSLASLMDDRDDTPEAARHEHRFLRKDGSAVLFEVIPSQAMEYEGRTGNLLVARDVTERNRLRSQLVVTDRLVSLGTLAAGVAHEINNPLTYISMNLDYVIEGLHSAGLHDLREAAQEAREGASRVQSIVRELKAFSRLPDKGLAAVDLRSVLHTSLRMAAVETRHRAQVVLDLSDVPRVLGDEARLGQVILNLLVNAAQAIPEGNALENVISVRLRTNPAGDVELTVSDTGVGISQENLGRVFDPFFTTKPVGVGTGLGLSICHGIVRSVGGDITVTSDLDRGTTFSVTFKAAPAAPTSSPPAPSDRSPPTFRILVVDDEEAVGRAVARALQRVSTSGLAPGSHVDSVSETSPAKALARLEAGEPFDMVLCDVMMPEMSGMDLYERTRKVAPEYRDRFVFMTGGTFTERASEFLAQVPNPCLEKPLDMAALGAAIRALSV